MSLENMILLDLKFILIVLLKASVLRKMLITSIKKSQIEELKSLLLILFNGKK